MSPPPPLPNVEQTHARFTTRAVTTSMCCDRKASVFMSTRLQQRRFIYYRDRSLFISAFVPHILQRPWWQEDSTTNQQLSHVYSLITLI